ncbi:nuclease SbcCD subunit C [Amyelois transitella]|uniref:nuclease SbcCD subunit C n=1 Tax=Amyelois transitella TaxID=680683 RepID=UPI00298FA329|nr:nuclease SbcCD subunit C [Amyelois transitella]XP_013195692.2 nuclease SbcCD subunit C [Amyelois transitella]XP_013195700.2 nuclease SbcCD subunit C [Amyelois transitella]
MEEDSTCASEVRDPFQAESQINGVSIPDIAPKPDIEQTTVPNGLEKDESTNKDESGVVLDGEESKGTVLNLKESFVEHEVCEGNDDARSLGDLDSLPAGDELALGAAGSDSGVEGCGRALSSGGGSRSCASSVVSCGSGCGSESSSLAGAPPRPRRRVNVTVTEPKRSSPIGTSTPRPVTAPRGPNLATRERARSREKPTPPEKPRPLTPKPRIRPTGDLPNLVRESPALRAKPTKTSTARCRTPNSPSEEKRWPANGPRLPPAGDASATRVAADKYGTLPRRRREADSEGSPKHESTPPSSRRPTVVRSSSSRSTTKTRVRIYAEKTSQTVLLGTDVESALAGIVPNIESRITEVSRCHRGVQVSARDSETARLTAALAAAEAAAAEEKERRLHAEAQLAAERAARLAAIAELESNSQRLLELAGAGAEAGAEGCLKALDEQLRAARELAARQRGEVDALRASCDRLHAEASSAREAARVFEARLHEAEREAAEMQEFLAAETGALGHSLREAEAELLRVNSELERRRAECRQLVRMCEQRRQEALSAAARARSAGGAAPALDALARRLRALTAAVRHAYHLPRDALEPTVYHNDAFSRSDSGEALSPEEEPRGGLLAAVTRALRSAPPLSTPAANDDERSRISDDNDNSADLLDSETEPCLVTDPEYAEEWWSGAEGTGAWSADELSPERESCPDHDKEPESASASERDSLRLLSAAIAQRQRSEAEDLERGSLLERVLALDNRLSELLRALRLAAGAAAAAGDDAGGKLAAALRDKIDVTEKNVADVVVRKLAELDASKTMMEQYRHSIENLKKQLAQSGDDDDDLEFIEEELKCCSESERRTRYEALDAAASALSAAARWPRLAAVRARIERLAFAIAASHAHAHAHTPTHNTIAAPLLNTTA